MAKFTETAPEYIELWSQIEIDERRAKDVDAMARKVLRGKETYQKISDKTGVPWWFVGVLHGRESGCDFSKHLHNGDPLGARTVRVPTGRPRGKPPFTWEASAIDALEMKGLHKVQAWPIERVCYEAERFNGFGYRQAGRPKSPYLWAGTNHYTRGKYVADHQYSATAIDKQSGCIAVLKRLTELDPSFAIGPAPTPKPIIKTVAKSRSLPALLNGALVMIAGFFTNGLSVASEWVGWAFGIVPEVASELQLTMTSSEEVAGALQIPWGKISGVIALGCVAVAFWRELQRKRVA